MTLEILTAQIKIYNSLISRGLFLKEYKGCCKGTRGARELLYFNQDILKECNMKRKNLAIARIDYKMAYGIVMRS